jgi:uncharacterized repeat protein (TIGR02543 family)
MKNTVKLFGIIALSLAFAMTACDDGNSTNDTTPTLTLDSITAAYTQGGTVYPTTPLNELKNNLTVTAHYSDSTTDDVTDYELSGTLTEGESTITVKHSGKTATFTVDVSAETTTEYWAITWHLNGGTAVGTYQEQIEKGTTLEKPTDPTKAIGECTFKGWYTNSALTDEYTFGTVNTDLNLYAKWQQTKPMFYWGNFIPEATTASAAWAKEFDINELVLHRENSRGHLGSGPAAGKVWGQETKYLEVADNKLGYKEISWDIPMGYMYLISPAGYGPINVTQSGIGVNASWDKYEATIDGVGYYIYVCILQKNAFDATQRFNFN